MNAKDANRYRMWVSVRGTLASHEDNNTWTAVPALVAAVGELDTIAANVAAQLEVTVLPEGAAVSKATALKTLAGSAHEVAAAIHAYATEIEDDELAAKVDFSLSDLTEGRPASVIARVNGIVALAMEHLEDLADYQVTQAKLTALKKKVETFEKSAHKPRLSVARKSAANKAVPRLLRQGQKILARRVDRLMVPFRASAPEFYAEYKTARKIVDSRATLNGKASNVISTPVQPELLKAA